MLSLINLAYYLTWAFILLCIIGSIYLMFYIKNKIDSILKEFRSYLINKYKYE